MSESTTAEPASDASPPTIVFGVVALDTDQPRPLADFYAALLGWQIERDDDDWVQIGPKPATGDGRGASPSEKIAFQLVPDYKPPTWPTQEVPQQSHLDLDVADLDAGERFALSLGARRMPGDSEDGSFRVFLDPSGHPFCLCQAD